MTDRDDNIVRPNFVDAPVEWILGPFLEEYKVVLDGRAIPRLTARRNADGSVMIVLDGRMGFDFPDNDSAFQAALLAANAMAIGAGYPSFLADNKEQPFAPKISKIEF